MNIFSLPQNAADAFRFVVDLCKHWLQEYRETGRWPLGEMIACVLFAVSALFGFGELFAIAHSQHWSKGVAEWAIVGYVLAVFLAGYFLGKAIRAARRRRRRAAKRS